MMKIFNLILGAILLLPIYIQNAFGIDIKTFEKSVFRPINLPAGTSATYTTPEAKIIIILNFAINLILYASGSIAVIFLIIGAIRLTTAYGNQEGAEEAKKTVKYALIGLLAVILSYAIVTNIINLIFRATV